MPGVNLQALLALFCFLLCLLLARAIMNIQRGKWPGSPTWVLYLRTLLGFLFAAAITFAFYAFAGIDILHR
ncbi:MAG: flagellar biosynthesis protein FliR [Synergistales bacterium]